MFTSPLSPLLNIFCFFKQPSVSSLQAAINGVIPQENGILQRYVIRCLEVRWEFSKAKPKKRQLLILFHFFI